MAFQAQSTAGEVPFETRDCSAIDSNVEMEDQAYARNDEKHVSFETMAAKEHVTKDCVYKRHSRALDELETLLVP